jgi:hypothetical protein
MAFLIYPLADFLQDCEGAGPLNRDKTVLQYYFPVNLHDWMPDNQIDMADCSNRAAERDSVSDANMKRERRLCAKPGHPEL